MERALTNVSASPGSNEYHYDEKKTDRQIVRETMRLEGWTTRRSMRGCPSCRQYLSGLNRSSATVVRRSTFFPVVREDSRRARARRECDPRTPPGNSKPVPEPNSAQQESILHDSA